MASPDPAKLLIVNADDFGLSPGINRGILAAHAGGVVTSASVMVRWPAAAEARRAAERHPRLSLGLHVDLGEWAYRDGGWSPVYEVLAGRADDAGEVAREVGRQVEAFRRVVGRDPTHLDSHQHVHRDEPLRSVLKDLAAELRVPLRHFDRRVRYVGGFYGQGTRGAPHPDGVSVAALLRLIDAIPAGVTELGCHPGLGADHASPYREERAAEVDALRDPRVRDALAASGVTLISFDQLPGG
jgi:predicted glycoside hydrolase/deacetylase ChbG (UPF0249 family)